MRERHRLLRRQASVLPRLHRHRQKRSGKGGHPRFRRGRRLRAGRLRPHRRRNRRAPRHHGPQRLRSRGLLRGHGGQRQGHQSGFHARGRRHSRAAFLRPAFQRLFSRAQGVRRGARRPRQVLRRTRFHARRSPAHAHGHLREARARGHCRGRSSRHKPHHGRRLLRKHSPLRTRRPHRPRGKSRREDSGHFLPAAAHGQYSRTRHVQHLQHGRGHDYDRVPATRPTRPSKPSGATAATPTFSATSFPAKTRSLSPDSAAPPRAAHASCTMRRKFRCKGYYEW